MGNRRLIAALALVALGSAACDEKKNAPATRVTMRGNLKGEGAGFLPGVKIIANCGEKNEISYGNDMGQYEVEIPTSGCDRLIFRFEKESYAPVYRVLTLPTTRGGIDLDVAMPRMTEIICGQLVCRYERSGGIAGDADQFARGWLGAYSGQARVATYPGEFFDVDGRPLLLLASYATDYRDKPGNVIARLSEPFPVCQVIDPIDLDQLQDTRPKAQFPDSPGIDADVFELDQVSGRWIPTERGIVLLTGLSCNGFLVKGDLPEEALGDVRGEAIYNREVEFRVPEGIEPACDQPELVYLDKPGVCSSIPGTGIFAVGYPHDDRACVVVEVFDQCGKQDPQATVEAFGNDRSFYTWAPTNDFGQVCLEGPRSEAKSEVQSLNGVEGETFWLNLRVSAETNRYEFEAVEMPTSNGSCGQPSSCIRITLRPPLAGPEVCGVDASLGGTVDAGVLDGGSGSNAPGSEGPVRLQGK